MKLQAILLGEYGTSPPTPFCLYQHDRKLYVCIEDMDALLDGYDTLSSRHLHPDHVLSTACDRRAFLLTDSVIPIARSRHLLALAELCQLTPAELMAGVVAAPLLASLGVSAAVPARLVHHPVDAIHVMSHHPPPQQQQQQFDSWLAHRQQRRDHKSQKNPSSTHAAATRDLHREEQRLASFMQRLSHHPLWRGMRQQQQSSSSDMWTRFASWFGDYHHDQKLRASFLGTFKTQRQQQAIIASRQRRAALKDTAATATTGAGPTSTIAAASASIHRVVKKRRSNSNTALANQESMVQPLDSSSSCCSSRSSTPKPSLRHSPVIRSCRSVAELHRPVPCKALQLPPPWPSPSAGLADQLLQPRKWASFHDLRGESNLDLLATQATQQQLMQQQQQQHQFPTCASSCSSSSSSSSSPSSQSSASSLPPSCAPPIRSLPRHFHHRHPAATSAIQLPPPSEMLARRHHPPPTGLV